MIILGRDIAGRDITLDPYSAAHILLTGNTRSGKSVQLYGMLAQLKGEPVKVCGIDPSGIVFNALGENLGGSA